MAHIELTETKLDIGNCFDEALEMYKKNFVLLIIAAAVCQALSFFSLLILAGPLWGGFYFMLLNAFRREDKRVVVGDLFRMMHRFWPLFLLLLVEIILVLLGLVLLVVPMLLVNCLLLYTQLLMVDRGLGVKESLVTSSHIVLEKGFGMHFLLSIICLALSITTSFIPHVGWLLGVLTMPLTALLVTSSYLLHIPIETVRDDGQHEAEFV